MIRFTEQITTEEYMELRRKVGWMNSSEITDRIKAYWNETYDSEWYRRMLHISL